jgi:methionyl-tRNA formyltransferase
MLGTGSTVLFLGKACDKHTELALAFCRSKFAAIEAHLGQWGDPIPAGLDAWTGEYIISYLSRWIVPERLLKNARIASINFHPGPPEYPGYGGNNFALYEGADIYGVTCHHMAARVDSGDIIAVKRFPLLPTDDVATLLSRAYDQMLDLFFEIMSGVLSGRELPVSGEKWVRRPFTKKEFHALGRITTDMTPEEVARRVRATTFGPYRPTIVLHGFIFEYKARRSE